MNGYRMNDDDYELVKSVLHEQCPSDRPCTTLQVVLIYDTGVVCSVHIAVAGLYARLMRLMDLNNSQMLDDPVIFERAVTVIEDKDTRWVTRFASRAVITPDKHKVSETQLERVERLYGVITTPLDLAHQEVDFLANTDSPEYYSAQAWERTLRNPRGNYAIAYKTLGGNMKQFPARMALQRFLPQGNNQVTIAWRYLVKHACMDKTVYVRLCVFLGVTEVAAAASFDQRVIAVASLPGSIPGRCIFVRDKITSQELAGIDVLNKQYDNNGAGLSEKDWTPEEIEENGDTYIAYNKALAWRDTISEGEPTYAKYAECYNSYSIKDLQITEAELKASFAGYMNRYATPGMSFCDPFSRLWFEEIRRKQALYDYDHQINLAIRRSQGYVREPDIPPSYLEHYSTYRREVPSIEEAYASANSDRVETLNAPPYSGPQDRSFLPIHYDFAELGALPPYTDGPHYSED